MGAGGAYTISVPEPAVRSLGSVALAALFGVALHCRRRIARSKRG
jgi:MYXO-CTERM domain-containing protein